MQKQTLGNFNAKLNQRNKGYNNAKTNNKNNKNKTIINPMTNQMTMVENQNMMNMNINKVVKDNKSKKITKKIQKRDNGLKRP